VQTRADKQPGPSLLLSIILLVLGVVVGGGALVKISTSFVGGLTAPAHPMGTAVRIDLGAGRYNVFERTGTRSGGAGLTFTDRRAITIRDVTVLAPTGESLPVRAVGGNETITRGSEIFTSAATFTTPAAGSYDITVSGANGGSYVVARPITETFARQLPWFGLGALAAVVAALGLVLLIVGIVRRSRRSSPPQAPPPYGWNPPPQ
jgi:hypothetical protein